MTKRLIILLTSLALVVPFLFYGCGSSGDTGSAGAAGATGATGATGPPGSGVVSNEACVVCHGQTNEFQIANVHEFDPITGVPNTLGTAAITITSVNFGAPAGDNVPVTFTFTFQATSAAGVNITSGIDLRTIAPSATPSVNDNLAFMGFLLAKLTPNATTGSNDWSSFVVSPDVTGRSSAPFRANRPHGVAGTVFTRTTNTPVSGTDTYSYTFPTSAVRVSDGYVDNVVMRAGIHFSVGSPVSTTAGNVSAENIVNSPVLDLFSTNLKLQNTTDRRPAANATLDVVNSILGGVGTPPTAAYPTRNNVTIEACNKCHDVLAIHGGSRRDTKLCVICHNPKLEDPATQPASYAKSSLLNLVHGIHTSQSGLAAGGGGSEDASEVKFPQSPRNCRTCHKGTDDHWKTRPTGYACGSCHTDVNFQTGAGHAGGPQPDSSCFFCHPATGPGFGQSVSAAHAAKDGAPPTPDNPYVLPGLAVFQYGIDNVTVDNTNAATVTFWVKRGTGLDNGDLGPLTFVNFLPSPTDNVAVRPSGFSGGPAFLIAHSGKAANPQDYTNWDEVPSTSFGSSAATGQPRSVNLIGLPITATDNTNTKFRARLTGSNSFPADAKMRAVALQSYFTQTNVAGLDLNNDGIAGNDNSGRHTPAVAKEVANDKVRRINIKSGYVNNTGQLANDPAVVATLTPIGCLECHQAFEGHGGSRVNNVQICVMCHNPSLTTSGRTIPDNVTIDPTVVAHLGSNPLAYPEVTQSFGELIHRLHAGFGNDPTPTSSAAAGLRQQNVRTNNFQIVRNRQATPGVYGVYLDSDEVTFPGDLTHCTKCHFANIPSSGSPGTPIIPGATPQSYKADLPLGVLFTTEKVTTGNPGETLAQIIGARQSFQGHDPSGNPTDLVDSPLAGKCGSCHDTQAEVGHFISTGGADIKNIRSTAELVPPTLAPDVTP